MSDDSSTSPATDPPTPPGQHRIALGLAAVVVIAIATVAGVVYQISQATAKPAVVAVQPNSLAVIDPKVRDPTHGVVDDIPLGAAPESMTAGYGKIWIGNEGGTVTATPSANPHRLSNIGVTIDPAWLAAGDGAVWVYDGQSRVAEIDPDGSLIEGPRRLWRCTTNRHVRWRRRRGGGQPGLGGSGPERLQRGLERHHPPA